MYTYTNISGELDEKNRVQDLGPSKWNISEVLAGPCSWALDFFETQPGIYTYISICSKCWDHFPWGCRNGPANCCIYGFSPGYALSELGWFVGFTGLFYFFYHSILYVHKLKTLARNFGCWDHWQVMLEKSRNLRHWLARGLDAPPPYPAWSQTSFWSILWMVFFPSTTDFCWDGATVLVLHFITGGSKPTHGTGGLSRNFFWWPLVWP